jgi:hypothetical protein
MANKIILGLSKKEEFYKRIQQNKLKIYYVERKDQVIKK